MMRDILSTRKQGRAFDGEVVVTGSIWSGVCSLPRAGAEDVCGLDAQCHRRHEIPASIPFESSL